MTDDPAPPAQLVFEADRLVDALQAIHAAAEFGAENGPPKSRGQLRALARTLGEVVQSATVVARLAAKPTRPEAPADSMQPAGDSEATGAVFLVVSMCAQFAEKTPNPSPDAIDDDAAREVAKACASQIRVMGAHALGLPSPAVGALSS